MLITPLPPPFFDVDTYPLFPFEPINHSCYNDFSDFFLLPQTPTVSYVIHMNNSLNSYSFLFFCLFTTKSLLFYDQIIFFLMGCILRLSRASASVLISGYHRLPK